jgi:rhodanese-related sulfurtransferase
MRRSPSFVYHLTAYAVAIVIVSLLFSVAAWAQSVPQISVQDAAPLIQEKKVTVLDVREPSETKNGYIENAILIPLGQVEQRLDELARYKDEPMIVMCASGGRSSQAIRALSKQGFSKLQNLEGGMNAWRKAQLPVFKD